MPYSRTMCGGSCSVFAALWSTFSSRPSSTAWPYSTSPRLTTSHSKLRVCTWALSLAKETPGTVLTAMPVCRERLEEGLPPGGFPHAAVGIDVDRSRRRAERAHNDGRAEERGGTERQQLAAGDWSGHAI